MDTVTPNHLTSPPRAKCNELDHLDGAEYRVLMLAQRVTKKGSKEESTFFASVPWIALRTRNYHDTATAAIKGLVEKGWLVPIRGNRDLIKKGGHFQSNEYRVLNHREWTEKNGKSECYGPRKQPENQQSEHPQTPAQPESEAA